MGRSERINYTKERGRYNHSLNYSTTLSPYLHPEFGLPSEGERILSVLHRPVGPGYDRHTGRWRHTPRAGTRLRQTDRGKGSVTFHCALRLPSVDRKSPCQSSMDTVVVLPPSSQGPRCTEQCDPEARDIVPSTTRRRRRGVKARGGGKDSPPGTCRGVGVDETVGVSILRKT